MTDEEIDKMLDNQACTQYGKLTKDDKEIIKELLKSKKS